MEKLGNTWIYITLIILSIIVILFTSINIYVFITLGSENPPIISQTTAQQLSIINGIASFLIFVIIIMLCFVAYANISKFNELAEKQYDGLATIKILEDEQFEKDKQIHTQVTIIKQLKRKISSLEESILLSEIEEVEEIEEMEKIEHEFEEHRRNSFKNINTLIETVEAVEAIEAVDIAPEITNIERQLLKIKEDQENEKKRQLKRIERRLEIQNVENQKIKEIDNERSLQLEEFKIIESLKIEEDFREKEEDIRKQGQIKKLNEGFEFEKSLILEDLERIKRLQDEKLEKQLKEQKEDEEKSRRRIDSIILSLNPGTLVDSESLIEDNIMTNSPSKFNNIMDNLKNMKNFRSDPEKEETVIPRRKNLREIANRIKKQSKRDSDSELNSDSD